MAIYPGGRWDPLPENATQSRIRPTQVILHTAVDAPGPTRLRSYFARQDVGVESHFWITLSGEVVQMMDTERRADANRYANRRPDGTGAISIETEDEGDPVGVPWTPQQLDAIEAVIRWAHEVHGIPLRLVSRPDEPGLGYHALFGAPSEWTPAAGKTCPGPTRIAQFKTVLLPRLEDFVSLTPAQSQNLASALYRTLLLREPDAPGLAYWGAFGEKNGATALIATFLQAAQAEIRTARSKDAKAIADLTAEVARLKEASAKVAVDFDAITEEVASRITERLAE